MFFYMKRVQRKTTIFKLLLFDKSMSCLFEIRSLFCDDEVQESAHIFVYLPNGLIVFGSFLSISSVHSFLFLLDHLTTSS